MTKQPKTLILCFDGTSNSFSDENTNVVRLFSALDKNDMDRQMCYYQPGIGTYVAPNSVWSPTLQSLAKIMDSGVAWYLDAHIMGGYRFLMENYQPGDKICLFGFSRGAYTARCLAGMLHKVGLLPKSNEEQISFAYKKYQDTTPNGKINARGFKAAFSRDVEIEFMGVWDTVSSVGFFSRHLPFTASNTIVRTFRHALALDEHRAKFKPNPWHRTAPSAAAAKHDPDKGTAVVPARPTTFFERISDGVKHGVDGVRHGVAGVGDAVENVVGDVVEGKWHRKRRVLRKRTVFSVDSDAIDDGHDDDKYHGRTETNVKEVWFAGCHSDVGGGSAENNQDYTLANPSLMWMVKEIRDSDAPITFKKYAFSDIPTFKTLTITLSDRPPRQRGQIPSFSALTTSPTDLTAAERRDVSQATAVDGYVGLSSSNGQGKWDLPPTPSTSGFTAATTVVGKEGRISMQGPGAPTPIEESLNEKADPNTLTEGQPVVPGVESEPYRDANAKMSDQLREKWAWWALELVPFWQYYQDAEGHWHKGFYWNRGRPREIHDLNPQFHSSVKLRVNYTPRAKLPEGAVVQYVD